jgi:hypothetical protein
MEVRKQASRSRPASRSFDQRSDSDANAMKAAAGAAIGMGIATTRLPRATR